MDLKKTLQSIAEQQLPRNRFMVEHTDWADIVWFDDEDMIYLVAGWGDNPDQVDHNNKTELARGFRYLELKREDDRRNRSDYGP